MDAMVVSKVFRGTVTLSRPEAIPNAWRATKFGKPTRARMDSRTHQIFGKIQIVSTRLIQSGGTIDVRRRVPRWNENSLVGHHLVSQNREFSLVYDPILG